MNCLSQLASTNLYTCRFLSVSICGYVQDGRAMHVGLCGIVCGDQISQDIHINIKQLITSPVMEMQVHYYPLEQLGSGCLK